VDAETGAATLEAASVRVSTVRLLLVAVAVKTWTPCVGIEVAQWRKTSCRLLP
jgi:hypothetical protein